MRNKQESFRSFTREEVLKPQDCLMSERTSYFHNYPDMLNFLQWREERTRKRPKITISEFNKNYPIKLSAGTREILNHHPEVQEYLLRTCVISKSDESHIVRICQIKNKLAERKISFPVEAVEKCFAQLSSLIVFEYYIEHHVPLPDPILNIFDPETALFLQRMVGEHKKITAMTLSPDAEIHKKTLFDIEKKLKISVFRRKIDTFYIKKGFLKPKEPLFSNTYGLTTFGVPKAQPPQEKKRPATALPAIRW